MLRLLRGLSAPVTEHALLQELEGLACWPPLAAEPILALFQKHFLLMNALYRIQESLWREEKLWLEISPLRIGWAMRCEAAGQAPAEYGDHALRAYYLDWRQFETTAGADVAQLLAGFWRRLRASEGRAAALAVLELDEGSDWAAIRRQYRRLAARTHPDRGGDREHFLAVRAAYESLRLQR